MGDKIEPIGVRKSIGVRTVDLTRGESVFAPSYQEQKGLEAVRKDKFEEARLWFDRAIIADPSRGSRIGQMLIHMEAPFEFSRLYSHFMSSATDKNEKSYQASVEKILKRHPELSAKNQAQLANESMYFSPPKREDKPKTQ